MAAHDPARLRAVLGAGAPAIAEIVPDLRDRLPDVPRLDPVQDPDAARFRLFDAISGFLRVAARDQPILLVLDNLHAADRPSLLLLEFLAPEVRQHRLLVLGTYRDVELTLAHPLSSTLGELKREAGTLRTLPLRGLTPDEVRVFIGRVAGMPAPESIVQAVWAQTEGNPLFVGEVVRLLLDEGLLGPSGAGATVPRSVPIPEGVKQVLGRRLSRLSPDCLRVLTRASVLGREFTLAELQRLCADETPEWVLDRLDEGLAARILEEATLGTYQFTHSLVRETLYDELSGPRRALLHRHVGEMLEDLYHRDLQPHLPRLAHHFAEAAVGGDVEKALTYALQAAERATALLAFEQAAHYCQTGLDVLAASQPGDPGRQGELLLALGEAQARAGEYPMARASFARAAEIARSQDLTEQLIRAALGFDDASWRPGLYGASALRLLEEALHRLPDDPHPLRAQLLGALGRALTFSGAWEEGVRTTMAAVDVARGLGDHRTLTRVLQGRTEAFFAPEIAPELLAIGEQTRQQAQERGDDETVMEILSWTPSFRLLVGDVPAATAEVDLFETLAHERQQPFFQYCSACHRVTLALLAGRFDEAERRIERARITGQRFKGIDVLGIYGIQMFTLRREQGRLGEVEPALRAFVQQHPAAATWRPGLALIYAELGLRAEAEREFAELALGEFRAVPRDALWSVCLAYLAEVCAFLGDRTRAGVLYRLLEPYQGYCIALGGGLTFQGAAARYLGQLASTMGDWPAAGRHFEDALDLETRAGAAPAGLPKKDTAPDRPAVAAGWSGAAGWRASPAPARRRAGPPYRQ